MSSNLRMVPRDQWNLDALAEYERREWLLYPPPSKSLIENIASDFRLEKAEWVIARDNNVVGRIEIVILLEVRTFDQFFNGRSGYRAQYYRSVDHGCRFNRLCIERITESLPTFEVAGDLPDPIEIRKSLRERDSKLWISDSDAFDLCRPLLKAPRWTQYYKNNPDEPPYGLCIPVPDPPGIRLLGSFIEPGSTSEPWVAEHKKDRDQKLHETGHV